MSKYFGRWVLLLALSSVPFVPPDPTSAAGVEALGSSGLLAGFEEATALEESDDFPIL